LVFLPLNTAYTVDELTYFIDNSGAALIVCDAKSEATLAPVAAKLGAQVVTLNADGSGSLSDRAAGQPESFDTVARTDEDLAAFLYTSGTTGRSKGAMLTQANLLSNAVTLTQYWRFTDADILLHALPIFHTHGLFVASNVTLLAGGAMIFLPKFDLDAMIAWMPKATAMMGVPTFYTRLLDDARFTGELTKHMRLFISGSAPLLAETHVQFETRTGHRILERYGMTETNMNTSNPYDGDRRAGTVGFPLPGVELKVTDPDSGKTLPDGEVGQIEVRGPNVFKGYWQMPEKTAAELRNDGFFITGDLGKIDEDGYVHIVGRNKDLIISGGYNIYPKEIELVLDEQPGVLESAVIGVPHPDFGETVLGIIVPEKGAAPDLEAMMAAVSQALARFKHPRKLILRDELPRNTMGKVQKNILRDEFGDMFTAS
ncbi:MAG TPA: malonyl-CoA synthase, partial [Roseovarius nubinhibens]|nr:malonyl-CoA synthase [Roseovarius nubinhibens]